MVQEAPQMDVPLVETGLELRSTKGCCLVSWVLVCESVIYGNLWSKKVYHYTVYCILVTIASRLEAIANLIGTRSY